jgi:anti-sigma regulatory factor (Ser/Thr protein kinase)
VSTNHRGPWPITTDLAALRQRIHHRATDAGLTGARLEDLLLAANEAAVNVLEHGGGSGTLAVWHDETELTVDVVDTAGRLMPRDVYHWRSSHQAGRGIGLWLMGRLCDEFTIHQDSGRSRVRLRMRLHTPAPPPLVDERRRTTSNSVSQRSSRQAPNSNLQRSSQQNSPAACGYDLNSVLERSSP